MWQIFSIVNLSPIELKGDSAEKWTLMTHDTQRQLGRVMESFYLSNLIIRNLVFILRRPRETITHSLLIRLSGMQLALWPWTGKLKWSNWIRFYQSIWYLKVRTGNRGLAMECLKWTAVNLIISEIYVGVDESCSSPLGWRQF